MSLDELVGGLGTPGAWRVRMHGRRRVEQRLHDPPRLLDTVLSREASALADHRGMQEHLVGSCTLTTHLGELHVEEDRCSLRRVGPVCVEHDPNASRRIEPDHELVGLRSSVERRETQVRRMLEDETNLGLRDRQPLARPDEEGDTGPAPVLDLETESGVRLGARIRCDAVDPEVALVLAAHIVSRVRGLDRAVQRDYRVLECLGVTARGGLHRSHADDLHEVVDDDIA